MAHNSQRYRRYRTRSQESTRSGFPALLWRSLTAASAFIITAKFTVISIGKYSVINCRGPNKLLKQACRRFRLPTADSCGAACAVNEQIELEPLHYFDSSGLTLCWLSIVSLFSVLASSTFSWSPQLLSVWWLELMIELSRSWLVSCYDTAPPATATVGICCWLSQMTGAAQQYLRICVTPFVCPSANALTALLLERQVYQKAWPHQLPYLQIWPHNNFLSVLCVSLLLAKTSQRLNYFNPFFWRIALINFILHFYSYLSLLQQHVIEIDREEIEQLLKKERRWISFNYDINHPLLFLIYSSICSLE